MATELNFNQDEEEDDQLGSPSTPSEAGDVGGSPAAPSAPARPTQPGGRPNIQQYLDANQGAGQKLAGGIQSKTEKQAQEVGRGIQQGGADLESSSQPLAQQLGDEGSQKIKTAFQNPAELLKQQDQLAQFQKLRTQGFKGDIEGVQQGAAQRKQQLSGEVNKLGQTADLSGSEGGRFELLRNTFGQPSYTRGQQKLDQLFLQAQPGAAKELQSGLQGIQRQQQQGLSGLDAAAQAKIQALTGLSGQRADEWKNLAAGGTGSGIEDDINQRGIGDIGASSQQRLAAAKQDVAGLPGLQERLKNNQLSNTDIDRLGLQRGQKLYDVDLSQYITQTPREATLAGTADPAEVARYRALQQLSGDTSGDMFGGGQDIGGFKAYEYDQGRLGSAIENQRKLYEVEQPNQLIDKYNTSMSNYINGGGGGMRGRRYYVPEQQALMGQLAGLKNAGPEVDRWAAIKNLVDPFVQQTGWTGYQDFLTPGYNQAQNVRGRALSEQQLPTSSEAGGGIDWDAVSDQLADSGWKLPTGKYQDPADDDRDDMLPDKK